MASRCVVGQAYFFQQRQQEESNFLNGYLTEILTSIFLLGPENGGEGGGGSIRSAEIPA